MIRKIVPITFAVATLFGTAVFAQETDQQQSGGDLDLGQTGPRVGEQFVKDTQGDWSISCLKAETGEDPCAMVQILDGAQGDPIAEVTVGKLPQGGAAVAWANVVVPLETLLQAQLALSIDGGPRKLYNYHHCAPVGCLAQLGFTQGDIDAMKSGTKATLSLVPARAPDQLLSMDMSLTGFTAAFDGLAPTGN